MTRRPPALALALAAALATSWATSAVRAARPSLPAMSEQQMAKVHAGKVVLLTRRDGGEASSEAQVTGLVQIGAPHEKVWGVLLDKRHSVASSGAVKSVDVLSDATTPDGTRHMLLAWHLKVAFSDVVYHTKREYRAAERTMRWTLDKSRPNDIADTVGSYSTHDTSTAGSIYLLYSSRIDTGRNVPRWLEEDLTESSLKRYLQYVKKVSEGG